MNIIKSKKQMFLVIGAFALILLLGTASYAFFNYTRTGGTNQVGVGRIAFNTDQGNDTLTLSNVFPMTSTQAQNANLDSVAVHITGDTTYDDGEEFEITLVNVTNTVNGKTIPINYTATYTATTGKDIGDQAQTNYFTERGSTTSVYDFTSTGEVEEGKQVLVGFIPKDGEVDGTLTIKAYIDSSKVVISDTLAGGAVEVTGYNNGYPNPGEGVTVLTTSEWNALQGANTIKFSVRGIANEGTWVEEAGAVVPGTIPSCSGCNFMYTTNTYYYGGASNPDATALGDVIDSNNIEGTSLGDISETYNTDYRTIVNQTEKIWFLGFTTSNGVIDKAYACGIYLPPELNEASGEMSTSEMISAGTPFCIEGALDDAHGGNSTTRANVFTANRTLITQLYGLYNEETHFGCSSSVYNGYSGASCYGSVQAYTDDDGFAGVSSADYTCRVNYDGSLRCYD